MAMTHIPAIDLATEIGSQVASLTLGTNLFRSMIRAAGSNVPKDSVFVWGSSGLKPLRTMGDPDEIRTALVHVRVRSAKFAAGSTLAHSIMNLLRGDDISTYLEIIVSRSEPEALGKDSDGNHYFGFEYLMTYQEP